MVRIRSSLALSRYSDWGLDNRNRDDWREEAQCREYDPEWWTGDHQSGFHKRCLHALALHICRHHCPVLAQCEAWARPRTEEFVGMVIAGVLWDERVVSGRRWPVPVALEIPTRSRRCDICKERWMRATA